MTRSPGSRSVVRTAAAVLLPLLLVLPAAPGLAAPAGVQAGQSGGQRPGALFFTSDGLRQDLVGRYAAQGVMPTMREFLRRASGRQGTGC